MLDADEFARLAQEYGTPLFLYDAETIRQNARRLTAALPSGALVFYAVKANPAPAIIRLLAELGFGAEVSSGGELGLALACGIAPSQIVLSGPAKSAAELAMAVQAGIGAIQAESADELARLQRICEQCNAPARVALRVHLDPAGIVERRSGWGGVTPFGMDERELQKAVEQVERLDRLQVIGVHNHQGSQYLDAARLIDRYAHFVRTAAAVGKRFALEYVNFGGGFGAPFYADDAPLDLAPLQAFFADLARPGALCGNGRPLIVVEPGRFLVGAAGYYTVRVVEVKRSFGVRFALLDGGTHHVLGLSATLRILRRPVQVFRPGSAADVPCEPTELAGPLCTPVDRLASAASLPIDLAPGDLLVFANCGAYAKQASPLNFLGHDWPAEVLRDGAGSVLIAPAMRSIDMQGVPGGLAGGR